MIRRHQLSTAAASLLSGAILTAVLAFGAPALHAEDIDRCQRRVAHADHELHEAIEKHGHNSRQARHERRELHEARERCCGAPRSRGRDGQDRRLSGLGSRVGHLGREPGDGGRTGRPAR